MQLGISTANSLAAYLANLWNGGWIDIYAGTKPSGADDPIDAPPLVSIQLPIQAFGTPVNGVAPLVGTWFATVAVSGTASWFRVRDASGSNHAAGLISNGGATQELTLSSNTLTIGAVVQITSFSPAVPMGN